MSQYIFKDKLIITLISNNIMWAKSPTPIRIIPTKHGHCSILTAFYFISETNKAEKVPSFCTNTHANLTFHCAENMP